MMARELLRILKSHGCVEVRQKGSHLMIQCGSCRTVVPVHPGREIALGTLRAIEKQLEACLGKGWLSRKAK
jgi:predicted RNA binding protein YcfA (HicA-like mRNA interferase family)